MKTSLICIIAVFSGILIAQTLSTGASSPETTIDLTNGDYDDLTCQYVEKYDLLDVNTQNCTSGNIIGHNCHLNYTYRADNEGSVFEEHWIQGSIASVEQTSNCVSINTGVFSESDYSNQVVVRLNNDQGEAQSYWIYNVASDPARAVFTLTDAEDLIKRGPTNFKNAQFGKGFLNYQVAGSDVIVYVSLDLIAFDSGATLASGQCPSIPIDSSTLTMRNCLDTDLGYSQDKLFFSVFKFTPSLWTYALNMIFFFIFTLGAKQEEPINQKYKDSAATYHSWVSVRNTGFSGFTKTARYTQIFLSLSLWCMIHTLYLQLNHTEDENSYNIVNLTVIPTAVCLVASAVLTQITGCILVSVTQIHRNYATRYKACTNQDQKVQLEDEYEGWKAHRYFAFYVVTFVLFQIFSWESIWQQEFFNTNFKLYYFINLAVTCAVEWLVIDWIRVVIGPGDGEGFIGSCLRRRGFWYDYGLHDLFEQVENDD